MAHNVHSYLLLHTAGRVCVYIAGHRSIHEEDNKTSMMCAVLKINRR